MSRKSKWILATVTLIVLSAALGVALVQKGRAEGNLTEIVNALIDNLLATGVRILELPLLLLLAVVGVLGATSAVLVSRLGTKRGRVRLSRVLLTVVVLLVVFAVAYVVDRKLAELGSELRELRSKASTDAVGLLNVICERNAKRRSFLFDSPKAEGRLRELFGEVRMLPLIYDEATDIVLVRRMEPIAQAYLAVVNLEHPTLEIRLGTTIKKKRPTSEFARENRCTVAINGEAGRSASMDSGFGSWIGNLIYRGEVILLEDTNRRPFLSFDRANRATYSRASVVDTTVTPEKYNVIWGRADVLLEGEVRPARKGKGQPRTAMAINKDGTRLYLLVVDGRQPEYSMGFNGGDVGEFLKAFGAHEGMLCDQGGSSCIYLSRFGGISNIPCGRRERPTYTHFGITLPAKK